MKSVKRSPLQIKAIYYSLPRSGERFNYFNEKSLNQNPSMQITGTMKDYSHRHRKIITPERKLFTSIQRRDQPDTSRTILPDRQANTDRANSTPKTSLRKIRISHIAYNEPPQPVRQRNNNTFRSFSFAKDNKETPDARKMLK